MQSPRSFSLLFKWVNCQLDYRKWSIRRRTFTENRDLKIPWTRRSRERRKPGARTPPPSGEKQIKIEQVGLSARRTREDKVMLSCFNSISHEVLLDWYLNDLLLEDKFVLPANTPVSLKKKPNFFEGNLRVWSEFSLSAICCQTFSLSVVLDLALKRCDTAPSLNWKWTK